MDMSRKFWKTNSNKTDDEVSITDSYVDLKEVFIEMRPSIEQVWSGHKGETSILKHLIELSPADTKATHSALYWAGP